MADSVAVTEVVVEVEEAAAEVSSRDHRPQWLKSLLSLMRARVKSLHSLMEVKFHYWRVRSSRKTKHLLARLRMCSDQCTPLALQ